MHSTVDKTDQYIMMARGRVKKKDKKKMMLTSMSVIIMSLN